jgi:hypothetical protein
MLTSEIAVLYSYAIFLIGRCDHQVPLHQLRVLIARWFFMATLTNRYTGSYETQVDAEMARLRDVNSAQAFCDVLERQLSGVFSCKAKNTGPRFSAARAGRVRSW